MFLPTYYSENYTSCTVLCSDDGSSLNSAECEQVVGNIFKVTIIVVPTAMSFNASWLALTL